MTKTYKAPTYKNVKQDTTPCERGFNLFPARLALKSEVLNRISQEGYVPQLPTGIPAEGDDYDLRLLRAGYLYILAEDVMPDELTTAKEGSKAWFVYRYHSPDMPPDKDEAGILMAYHFQQYHSEDSTLDGHWVPNGVASPWINLPEAVNNIEIAYSDFRLPTALLKQLSRDATMRAHWLRKANIAAHTGSAAPLADLLTTVKDFQENPADLLSNVARFTPIGYRQQALSWLKTLPAKKGAVLAVEDTIGTQRDLALLQSALDEKRKAKLAPYDYAITTASIIDAEAKRLLMETNQKIAISNARAPYGHMATQPVRQETPITFADAYERLMDSDAHLAESADSALIEELKAKFNLSDLPGINPINKLANLAAMYGDEFKRVVAVQAALAAKTPIAARYDDLDALIQQGDVAAANALCLYIHGLYWGLDQSSYGVNALLAASSLIRLPENATDANTIKALQLTLRKLSSSLSALGNIVKSQAFVMANYDLMIETIASVGIANDEMVTAHVKSGNKTSDIDTYEYERRKNIGKIRKQIQSIYEVNPFSQKIKFKKIFSEKEISRRMDQWIQRTSDGSPSRSFLIEGLPEFQNAKFIEPENNYKIFQKVGGVLSGAAKFFSYSVVFGFFYENPAKTMAGKLAMDPVSGTTLLIAGIFAPGSALEMADLEEGMARILGQVDDQGRILVKGKPLELADSELRLNGKMTKTGKLGLFRARLLSFNTVLTGLGAAMEYGFYVEAEYGADRIGMWAALVRGSGSVTLNSSLGMIGWAKLLKSQAWRGLLISLGTIGIAIGVALILIGIAMSFYSKSEIQRWIKFGYWGASKYYWGTPERRFEWSIERLDEFKDQFSQSEFKFITDRNGETHIEPATIRNYYQIELQRYFEFAEEISVTWVGERRFRVNHPNLMTAEDARAVRVKSAIASRVSTWQSTPATSYDPVRTEPAKETIGLIATQPGVTFIEEGVAELTYPQTVEILAAEKLNPGVYRPYGRQYAFAEIRWLTLSASVADYRGSEYTSTSDPETFDLNQ